MDSKYNNPVRLMVRLDVKGPNLIKGIQLDGYRVLGLPERFAEIYYQEGIDELIFQDTVASLYQRNSLHDIIRKTAERIFIPITVAGGIRTIVDIQKCLNAGADKVAINTAAVDNPQFLYEAVQTFGAQCIVSSLEVFRYTDNRCEIWTDYGRQETGIDAFKWADRVVKLGVGEIMLTSINREGTGRGFDIDLVSRISAQVPVPVIAVGGAGKKEDFAGVMQKGRADAVAAASIFHYNYAKSASSPDQFNKKSLRMGEHIDTGNIDFLKNGYGGLKAVPVTPASIQEVKNCMAKNGVAVRVMN